MIQASELRLGNLVFVDNKKYHPKLKNIPVVVTGIEKKTLTNDQKQSFPFSDSSIRIVPTQGEFKDLEIGQLNEFIKPIELTEERLLQCGFKHTGNGFYELLGTHIGLCNIGDVFFNVGFKGITIGNIKYLHQLQNLYFALTGKELEINL
ncbi:hypothetical protein [Myroides odoratus]|uniref:Uncharacterized protein n=1 Tax=Myroides odoratus TaxID=256 RepID=A0A9Q6Z792_MYROD|nr:hypothetical protein [Myroides odoratus]EHQ41576.1 hypothetical protein Myrod_0740 [Myroides odoratus DSM 2801]EKB02727.1 hypothetical protein HMPREF9716_03660 [Myroides odoratus CIP 103059]QQT98992.1 hypothetical protein I6I88_12310 [Myroides odoratus]WQD58818.1 hypothetical protein U0010_06660 [Myroides odoratus]STZ28840.1 Uncharacterised protein [Myroides odoratus]